MMNATTIWCIALTLASYVLARRIAKYYPSPFTTPVFFSTALITVVLLAWRASYADYAPAKDWLVTLLGPATVALAVPIYNNRVVLKANAFAAVAGVTVGALSTVTAAFVLGALFGFPTEVLLSLTVKSVTAPIAVELVQIIHGDPALAAIFVISTGMLGVMFGPWLMNRTGIHDPLSRGLALGTVSHGQGTAHALGEGDLQGAIAGIAMGISAALTAFSLPIVIGLLAQ